MSKTLIGIILLSAVLILSIVAFGAAQGEIVARVNGTEITRDDFYSTLQAEAGEFVLRKMILEELLRQRQEALGVTVTNEDVAETMNQFLMQIGGEQNLDRVLASNNMTREQLEEQVRMSVILDRLSKAEVEVSDAEVKRYFLENQHLFDQPEEVQASHILVEDEALAQELLQKVEEGADFAELAKEHSTDTGSASRGGDLGFFGRGMMVPPFEEKAFALEVGQAGIVQSDFGWHVIKVFDRKEGQKAQFEDVADQVRRSLIASKALDSNEYLTKLEEEANIEILLDLPTQK